MNRGEKMERFFDLIENVISFLVKFLSVVILVLSVFQVISRYVINYSFSFTTEVSIYLFIWIVMLGSGILVREKGHPAVTLLVDKLPAKLKPTAQFIQFAFCILFLSVLFYQGLLMALNMMNHLSPAAQIPMGLVYLALPVGTLIMLIYIFEGVIKSIRVTKNS